jgi:hypothetical protein
MFYIFVDMKNESLIPLSRLITEATLNERGELILHPAPGKGKCLFLTADGFVGAQECGATMFNSIDVAGNITQPPL